MESVRDVQHFYSLRWAKKDPVSEYLHQKTYRTGYQEKSQYVIQD